MSATIVVGGLFGDEGKGKIISYLALKDDFAAAVRGGVGPNAGHTVVYKNMTYRLRMLPSAIVNPRIKLMIGSGVLIDPMVLLGEIESLNVGSRVVVDYQSAVIEEDHKARDRGGHLKEKIGTTGSGTGPANADRVLRICRLAKEVDALQSYLGDVALQVNELMDKGRRILVEGTQGTFLSLYHGTYPYVTSKDVTASAVCSDIGIGPKRVDDVILVFKSYVTRVGEGPLEAELSEEEVSRRGWREVGTVTGRMRRAAPFNSDLAKRAAMLNSATEIALTKLDVVFPDCRGVTRYEDLTDAAKDFVSKIERDVGVDVTLIGTGADLTHTVDRRSSRG